MMVDIKKANSKRKPIIVGLCIASIFVNGVFFPIVNFNPDSPVHLETILQLIIIVMAFAFHKAIGSIEAIIFSKWPAILIGIFNVLLILCGLICRYLLEFGEVSNTYNFTTLNVSFQVIALAATSTIVCLLERKKI